MKKSIVIVMVIVLAISSIALLSGCDEVKIKLIDVELSNEQYAFGVKKGNTELLNSVNSFLVEKKSDIDAIFDKYASASADELTSFGNADIKTTPTIGADELVVATNLEFSPFEYTNGTKIAGIDMEIAQLLADYLNKTLVVVHMDFDAVVTTVQTQSEYDIAIAGLSITPDRAEQLDFCSVYYNATQSIIVKEDDTTFDDCMIDGKYDAELVEEKLASLTGEEAICSGQRGTTSQYYIEGNESFGFSGYSNLTFKGHSSAAEAVEDMKNGNIAFVVVDQTTAKNIIKSI